MIRRSFYQLHRARQSCGHPAYQSTLADVDHDEAQDTQLMRFNLPVAGLSDGGAIEDGHQAKNRNVERIITTENCGVQKDAGNMEDAG